jgi:hypothetical protein
MWRLAIPAEFGEEVFNRIAIDGIATISTYTEHPGRLAAPRLQDGVAALNRNRDVRIFE